MALDACVREILCGLSAGVLASIDALITAQKVAIQARITATQAQILQLDVALVPVELARAGVQLALQQARSAASLIPMDLLAGCGDLGEFNVDLVESTNVIQAEAEDFLDDLNRLLSFKQELNFLVSELNSILSVFDEIQAVIATCGE